MAFVPREYSGGRLCRARSSSTQFHLKCRLFPADCYHRFQQDRRAKTHQQRKTRPFGFSSGSLRNSHNRLWDLPALDHKTISFGTDGRSKRFWVTPMMQRRYLFSLLLFIAALLLEYLPGASSDGPKPQVVSFYTFLGFFGSICLISIAQLLGNKFLHKPDHYYDDDNR